jgi:hypothetical protein
LHCIKLLDQRKLNNKLKVIISPLSKTKSESKSFAIMFYGTQMAVTAVVVTKNVRMSRRWKAELVTYGIRIQP